MINNVLDMARIESGTQCLDLAVTDFASVLTDTERMFRLRAAEKHLSFQVVRTSDVSGLILMDAGKVRQVLINLLGNAMKFTLAGSITLRATVSILALQKVHVVLEVEDTGIGIAAHQLQDVFLPFVQVAPGAARSGTGLGLGVSRRFAQLMGGDVTVVSTLGVGSTFRFEFEADCAEGEASSRAAPRVVGLAEGSPRIRVLLVEDEPDNRAMLTQMLSAVGLAVRDATDVEEAVATFAKEPCEIILTDMRLEDGNGLDVMRRIRALPGGAKVPVVVVSASVLLQEREDVIAAGVDGFVGKPVRESVLFQEIARLTAVTFRYAGSPLESAGAESLSQSSLEGVPVERRTALIAALHNGYLDEIGDEIDAMERAAPGLAQEIRKLADRFQYTTLIQLLESDEGKQ